MFGAVLFGRFAQVLPTQRAHNVDSTILSCVPIQYSFSELNSEERLHHILDIVWLFKSGLLSLKVKWLLWCFVRVFDVCRRQRPTGRCLFRFHSHLFSNPVLNTNRMVQPLGRLFSTFGRRFAYNWWSDAMMCVHVYCVCLVLLMQYLLGLVGFGWASRQIWLSLLVSDQEIPPGMFCGLDRRQRIYIHNHTYTTKHPHLNRMVQNH